jgi:hypothetical protein
VRHRALAVAGALSAVLVPTAAVLAAKPAKPVKATPGRVSIGMLPSIVTWGTTGGIGGHVTGGGSQTGSPVVLQAETPPAARFHSSATGAVDARGQYNFRVSPGANTRYRVMAGSGLRVQSSEVLMFVRMRASLRVSDSSPTRGQRVRFSGSVSPAHVGLVVHIQKRDADGSFRNVARTFLVAGAASSSRYSGVIRVYRNGVYRVLVPSHAEHVKAVSGLRLLRVAS